MSASSVDPHLLRAWFVSLVRHPSSRTRSSDLRLGPYPNREVPLRTYAALLPIQRHLVPLRAFPPLVLPRAAESICFPRCSTSSGSCRVSTCCGSRFPAGVLYRHSRQSRRCCMRKKSLVDGLEPSVEVLFDKVDVVSRRNGLEWYGLDAAQKIYDADPAELENDLSAGGTQAGGGVGSAPFTLFVNDHNMS
ncbi:hypothetical protein B0H13DRAFT_2362102 [Mycena leptocephala]|nr:hypothetical protein B0H13DRAFT_2362102 [Mycena leptocephala]